MAWMSNEQNSQSLPLLLIATQGFLKKQVFYQTIRYGLGDITFYANHRHRPSVNIVSLVQLLGGEAPWYRKGPHEDICAFSFKWLEGQVCIPSGWLSSKGWITEDFCWPTYRSGQRRGELPCWRHSCSKALFSACGLQAGMEHSLDNTPSPQQKHLPGKTHSCWTSIYNKAVAERCALLTTLTCWVSMVALIYRCFTLGKLSLPRREKS